MDLRQELRNLALSIQGTVAHRYRLKRMLWSSGTGGKIKNQKGAQCGNIKQDSISKLTNTKRAGKVHQIVEHLPSNCKSPKFKSLYGQNN
jgi:hypothetical protein